MLAQDALVSALKQWPKSGIPDKPGAWLMPAAKLRAFDRLRRTKLIARKHEELARERAAEGEAAQPDLDAARRKGQDLSQVAMKRGRDALTRGPWAELDAIDQRAEHVGGLCSDGGIVERLFAAKPSAAFDPK